MKRRCKRLKTGLVGALIAITFAACCILRKSNSDPSANAPPASEAFPNNLQNAISKALPSVIEVVAVLEYRIEEYAYETKDDEYIRDPNSPVGYKLRGHNSGIIESQAPITAFGGGIIIGANESEILILTSEHLVVHADTVTNFIYRRHKVSDIPRTRAFLVHEELSVREGGARLRPARLVAADGRFDIALISVLKKDYLGHVYTGDVLGLAPPEIGTFAVVVGDPDEIQQVSIGLVNEAPYPGNFSVSVHGDFGFSGGPIFVFEAGAGLLFAGISKSVPGERIFFVTPDSSLRYTTQLSYSDVPHLQIEEIAVLSPLRIFGVEMKHLVNFLKKNMAYFDRKRFRLSPALEPFLQ